ncbi:hypothetical protein QQ008_20785 [Fulvivirgaceae bacterium BMA10]|uniref:Uncharacterized protein n=1 Tax=Splendidivirga corallicola TaxID=3051826 RepID=A0ABT8KSW3_9BACT|nr:hypothetical protein [Fulvivirgaceae bacterium BMA10]
MQKKGNLFQLIKSLTQTEKRYFKLYCSSSNVDSNYIGLFNALDNQEVFDESEIKEKFKDRKFINQLHVTKNYLSNLILKSLRSYHSKISKNAELKDLLRDVEILFSKELFNHCHYTLLKAERIAKEYENHTAHIEILEWQRKLTLTQFGHNHDAKKLDIILHEQNIALQKLLRQNEHWDVTLKVPTLIHDQYKDKSLKKHPALKEQPDLQSNVLFHHIMFSENILKGNPDRSEPYIDELIQLLEKDTDRIKEEPGSYINTLNNKISFLLFQKRWQEVLEQLDKVRRVPARLNIASESKFTIRTILRTYNIELELYRDRKEAEKGITLIAEVTSFMNKYERSIPRDYFILFWNQFANLYFLDNQFKSALVWINKIIDLKSNDRIDIQSFTRLLHLIIHLELGNIIFLRYAVESHRRFLKKRKMLGKFERICLRFFSRVADKPKSEHREQFQIFHKELFEDDPNLVTANILDYIDIKDWINKHLQ